MVKHVKLFENWAEENVELPEWLDPDIHKIEGVPTVYNELIRNEIKNSAGDVLDFGYKNYLNCNFKSFSDYTVWEPEYRTIKINQGKCKYRLEDLYGLPKCQSLQLYGTDIKSLKGIEPENVFLRLEIQYSLLENLKYCPNGNSFDFNKNPLLSYYGIKSNNIVGVDATLCGFLTYDVAGYDDNTRIPMLEQLNDPKFNGDIFCYFPFGAIEFSTSRRLKFNPWNQIYEDPNGVENYDFLFVPFYLNSENFRSKAKEYIKNLDITSLDRSDLW